MRARLATAVLVVSLAAAGCSGDEEPDAGPTLPPVTEAPSPTAEAVPSEATAATPEGAAEFGRFFYESIERAFQTADASTLEAISSPACEICQRYVSSVQRLEERDERVEGNAITVKDSLSPSSEGPTTTVTVLYDNTASRRLSADGQVIREEPARQDVLVELVLSRAGDRWMVTEVRAG